MKMRKSKTSQGNHQPQIEEKMNGHLQKLQDERQKLHEHEKQKLHNKRYQSLRELQEFNQKKLAERFPQAPGKSKNLQGFQQNAHEISDSYQQVEDVLDEDGQGLIQDDDDDSEEERLKE